MEDETVPVVAISTLPTAVGEVGTTDEDEDDEAEEAAVLGSTAAAEEEETGGAGLVLLELPDSLAVAKRSVCAPFMKP